MPSNPMQRKVRNSFFLGFLVMLIVAILIGAIVFLAVIKPMMDEEKTQEGQITAYAYRLRAGVSVESGSEITSNMVESVEVTVPSQTTDFILSKMQGANGVLTDLPFEGGKSKIALGEGTILTYSMLMEEDEVSDSTRYVEYNMITIPTTLDVGSYVDIRLRLPNAQDLIVIAKKEIESLYDQTIGVNLSEEEILLLNSAIVEAYAIPGSELYLARYVEAGNQETATYTYSPTEEVVTLIRANPNIVEEARNEIATRYASSGPVRNPINNALNQNAEDRKSNVEAGMLEQIEAARKAREDYLSELNGY